MKNILRFVVVPVTMLAVVFSGSVTANAATDADARTQWRQYASEQLDKAKQVMALPNCAHGTLSGVDSTGCYIADTPEYDWSYRAATQAFLDGSWSTTQVQTSLTNMLSYKKPASSENSTGGYGWEYQRDAFQDGTANSLNTVYTVDVADHVGWTALAAYQAGALPSSEVQFVVDSLTNQPITHTAYGDCMAYSSSPNDVNHCVINVSIGAAAFLKKASDAGFVVTVPTTYYDGTATNYTSLNDFLGKLGDYAEYAYSHPSETGVTRAGWLPYQRSYAVGNTPGKWTGQGGNPEQDWNHQGYTAEAMYQLGNLVTDTSGSGLGLISMQKTQDLPNYWQNYKNANATVQADGLSEQERGVQGRMRVAANLPSYKTTNLWQDVQTYERDTASKALGYRNAADYLQAALWASKLAVNATADSITARTTTFMSAPRAYNYDNGNSPYTATTPTVPKGTRVTLRTDTRAGNSTSGWIFIPSKNVTWMRQDGTNLGTKPTGIAGIRPVGEDNWNVQWVWTADINRCFYMRADDGFQTIQKCINVS